MSSTTTTETSADHFAPGPVGKISDDPPSHSVAGSGETTYSCRLPSNLHLELRGNLGLVVRLLVDAGPKGLSSIEFSGSPYRLDSYISTLRRKVGLTIQTIHMRGRHSGKSRYVLVTPLETIPVALTKTAAEDDQAVSS